MTAALLIGTIIFCALSLFSGIAHSKNMAAAYKKRICACTTYVIAILLWPMLFHHLIGFDLIPNMPLLTMSLVWPFLFLSINILHATRVRNSKLHGRTSLQMDVNALTGFCFAIGSLLASQMGKRIAVCTSSIFSTAFLLCLAFVMPSPEIPDDYTLSVVVETIQQSFLQYAIALLIAGISINLSISDRVSGGKMAAIAELMNKTSKDLEGELSKGSVPH